jgi:hypothetical protein
VGDVAGVRIPPYTEVYAPTPPPDIDVAAWERSLDTIAAWQPTTLAITHFGAAEDPEAQLARCREALHAEADLAAQHDLHGFVAAIEARIREGAGADAESIRLAAPPDQLYLGLDRWHSKRATA